MSIPSGMQMMLKQILGVDPEQLISEMKVYADRMGEFVAVLESSLVRIEAKIDLLSDVINTNVLGNPPANISIYKDTTKEN